MESQTIFAALRDALATLYPAEQDARVIVDDAGLIAIKIISNARPKTNWHNILVEALHQNRLDALLDVARRDYINNKSLVIAHANYQRLLATGGHLEIPVSMLSTDGITPAVEASDTVAKRDTYSQSKNTDSRKKANNKNVNSYHTKAQGTRIVLTIEGDIKSFSQQDREILQRIIAEVLNMNEPITIYKVEPGSIKVTLELPPEKAKELYGIVKSGRLRQNGIIDVTLSNLQPKKAEVDTIPLLDEEQVTQFRLATSGRRSVRVSVPYPGTVGFVSEKELIDHLKTGDEFAWQILTTGEYRTRLYNYLIHQLPNRQDVEDVLHETFVTAMPAIQDFDARIKLSTFLFSLAQHKLADFWRRQPETVELSETVIGPGLSQESIEFIEILQRLKDEHRQVLLMRYDIGLSIDEIAAILGKTYRGTESLLSRARAELKMAMIDDSNK